MARKLVVTGDDGGEVMLTQVDAADEHQLQERLKDSPELLPLDDMGMSDPALVIGRESVLPSGRIDLLLLMPTGELCIAEMKTGPQNPDFRAALAQLLDYGSDLWGMSVEELESRIILPYFNSDRCPPAHKATSLSQAALAAWGDVPPDAVSWRERLEQQLETGDFAYALVAQRFSTPTLRTVTYLNDTTTPRFFAVELIQFSTDTNGGPGAFEARLVGGPSNRGKAQSKTLSGAPEFLTHFDEQERSPVAALLDALADLDVTLAWGTSGVSVRVQPQQHKPVSIAWLFPPGVSGWMGLTDTTLGYYSADNIPPELQGPLEEYVSQLATLPEGTEPKSANVIGRSFAPMALADNFGQLFETIQVAVTALTT